MSPFPQNPSSHSSSKFPLHHYLLLLLLLRLLKLLLHQNPSPTQLLTQEELTKINLLLPRLCLSNHLPTAIDLTSTVLLKNPPPKSLSLSVLVDSLTSQPYMSLPMSLLTHLKHNPAAYSYLTPITTMLIASYFKKHKPKEALKVFNLDSEAGLAVCAG